MSNPIRTSWKTLPPPQLRESLPYDAVFSASEYEMLGHGLIPREMEDKWFIYLEGGWLNFHRSWTGAQIYGVRLEKVPEGWRTVDSWVNRDPTQYKGSDVRYDGDLLRFLIDAFLLRKRAHFPMPPASANKPEGVVQHHYVGRAYPEKPSPDDA
jgi:hypothetical protein